MWRNDDILIDIANAAQHILEFQIGFTRDTFLQDLRTQSAILHQLIIIGEATKRLSDEFRALHPELPWTKIAGIARLPGSCLPSRGFRPGLGYCNQ